MSWMELSGSELLFWVGIVLMAAAVVSSVACIILFCVTGWRLRRKLEEEYGKPVR